MSGIALDTPLADSLTSLVHTKITEDGWSQEDDASLAEYIVLMLVNGKTQDEIASELASELLQGVDGIPQFARWLFDQVVILKSGRSGGAESTMPATTTTTQSIPSFADQEIAGETEHGNDDIPAAYDADMGDNAPDNAPRGPKGMHGGRPTARGGRMGGQVNKAMDRTQESVLHRVRGQSGTERINTHMRGAPKGPRGPSREARPGLQKALNGMGMPGPGANMPNPMMSAGGQGQNMMQISPQQQMEFMAMMEQQARMMAQLIPGMVQPAANPAFPANGAAPQSSPGRSLFDRVEAPGRGRGGRGRGGGRGLHSNGTRGGHKQQETPPDTNMDTDTKTEDAASASMEGEQPAPSTKPHDPFTTMCRFNLRCINKDCHFVHSSPVAPPNTIVDMSDTCAFGVACKNSRCVGRHPSPAQKLAHQADVPCKFDKYCTNETCPYKHSSSTATFNMPMCRNGADCTVEHCKFTHLTTVCKFHPCLNPNCVFKHEAGQRGVKEHVWTPAGSHKRDTEMGEDGKHVSERKFVVDEGEEELIKPESPQHPQPQQPVPAEEVIT